MILKKADKYEYKLISKLYKRAFPFEERAPFFCLKIREKQGRAEMLAAKENDDFVGFAYTVEYKDTVYLFYFAVNDKLRGKGNGSKILSLLKEYYSGKKIFLAREQLDENSNNYNQRVKRHQFYLKNGFEDFPFCINEAKVVYDVMGCGGNVTSDDYNALIRYWAGSFAMRLIKMQAFAKQ